MNRNLLGLSVLMILFGAVSGFYLLSIIGLVIMIPAFLSGSRLPTRPPTSTARRETRRIIPPPVVKQPEPTTYLPPQQGVVPVPSTNTMASPTFSQALFPNAIFPSLSLVGGSPQATAPGPSAKSAERDELLEFGAILALLKIALG